MKNKLVDLNDHLFAELERLSDEDLKGDALKEEIGRAREIGRVAGCIIENGTLLLNATKFADDHMAADTVVPKILIEGDES